MNREWFLAKIIFIFFKIFEKSYTIHIKGESHLQKAINISPNSNYILSFWHQNLIIPIILSKGQKNTTIISPSKDGEIISQVCSKYDLKICRGSSSRNSVSALKQIIKYLKRGYNAYITIDGPTGPIFKAKPGVFQMSKISGCPILPVDIRYDRFFEFNSWDKFKVPKPFANIYMTYKTPITTSRETSKDDITILKERLNTTLS